MEKAKFHLKCILVNMVDPHFFSLPQKSGPAWEAKPPRPSQGFSLWRRNDVISSIFTKKSHFNENCGIYVKY